MARQKRAPVRQRSRTAVPVLDSRFEADEEDFLPVDSGVDPYTAEYVRDMLGLAEDTQLTNEHFEYLVYLDGGKARLNGLNRCAAGE